MAALFVERDLKLSIHLKISGWGAAGWDLTTWRNNFNSDPRALQIFLHDLPILSSPSSTEYEQSVKS
jgi:hypothetical protein